MRLKRSDLQENVNSQKSAGIGCQMGVAEPCDASEDAPAEGRPGRTPQTAQTLPLAPCFLSEKVRGTPYNRLVLNDEFRFWKTRVSLVFSPGIRRLQIALENKAKMPANRSAFSYFALKSVHFTLVLPCFLSGIPELQNIEFSPGKTHFLETRKMCSVRRVFIV